MGAATTGGARSADPRDPLTGDATTPADAIHRADVMLDRAYILGAVGIAAPDSYVITTPPARHVQRERWVMVTGTYRPLLALLRSHPPAGFVAGSTTLMPTAAFSFDSGGVVEYRPVGRGTSSMQVLDVTATNLGGNRIALRLDATVGWDPAAA